MLRRQQAEVIIDVRSRIVEGSVGMVKMALIGIEGQQIVALDQARCAALVSNLLVVLCSESEAHQSCASTTAKVWPRFERLSTGLRKYHYPVALAYHVPLGPAYRI
jgi:hypothetical protein